MESSEIMNNHITAKIWWDQTMINNPDFSKDYDFQV